MEKAIEVLKKELQAKEYIYKSYIKKGITTNECEKNINSLKYAIEILERACEHNFIPSCGMGGKTFDLCTKCGLKINKQAVL